MSSDNIRDWEYFKEKIIPQYIDRLANVEEQKSKLDKTRKDIVLELADRCEKFMPSDEIARFLVKELKDVASKSWIELILGTKHKRPYDRYQPVEMSSTDISNEENDNSRTIEVSSTGEQEIGEESHNPAVVANHMPEPDDESHLPDNQYSGGFSSREIIPESEVKQAEIEVLKKKNQDLEIRLNEALLDKDKREGQLLLQIGELEIRLTDLKNEKKSPDNPNELQRLRLENEQLKEVEAIHTKKLDFTPASQISSPKDVWIAASNLSGFIKALVGVSMKFDPFSSQRKVIFDLTDDGQLKNPRPEGS